ncbi:hypothetical protein Tco_0902125, partial [Tanacetum coccineum]
MCLANRYNYKTSNSAESINNLTRHVIKVRVTKLMEWYRALLQKWYCDRCEKYKDSNVHTLSDWATHKVMDRMQKSANCELALGWFRKTMLCSTYQELVYSLGESSTRHCPDGFVRGHTRASCHEPIPNYRRSQVEEYEEAYNNNNGRSQEYTAAYNNNNKRSQEYEYEAAYNNNNRRSQEYAAAYNNNNKRSQEYEYEAAYNNNNGRSQEYARANNNNYGRTQEYEYEAAYNNNNERLQEYAGAYNNSYGRSQEYVGAYFNGMYNQPNNMGFAFNFGQSSQQTNSTWDHVN